jgi:hypothetical protein
MVEAVAVTREWAGGVMGAGAAGSGVVAEGAGIPGEDATVDVDGGTGTGACSAGSDERWATVITAVTKPASTTIPNAASSTEVQRRSGVKSGNSVLCEAAAADHGPSTSLRSASAAKPTS